MIRRVGLVGVAAVILACAELGGILKLQQELVRELGWPQITVRLSTGAQLTVLVENAPLGNADSVARERAARRIAEFVRDHYVAYAQLATVNVVFSTRRAAGPVALTSQSNPYSYRTVDLGPPVRADSTGDSTKRT